MFIVKNRAIVTKVGVKGKNESVKREQIGKNWEELISLGWIEEVVEKKEIIEELKNNATEAEVKIVEPEVLMIKTEFDKKQKRNKKNIIGIVKKEEIVEKEEIIEEPVKEENIIEEEITNESIDISRE